MYEPQSRPADLEPVEPARPIAPYIGGKRNLSRRLCEMIDSQPHSTYVEPFVGMGGVFFRRKRRPGSEVINDISGDVTTLFRILQRHYPQFLEVLKFQITSRREFDRLKATDPSTLTDLERAARFLYLQRTAFGGKVSGQHYGVAKGGRGARFNLTTLVPMLEDIHERLSGVQIECLPYQELIPRYDRGDTLFYLDPPYYGCEDDYGKDVFSRDDFERLADCLGKIKGRFILSLNDVPAVREIFDGFEFTTVGVNYGLPSGAPMKAKELIITGGLSE